MPLPGLHPLHPACSRPATPACTFPFPTGIVATHVGVRAVVLAATEVGGSRATEAAVGLLELEFPTLRRPLTLRLSGVRLAVQQVRLPRVSPPLAECSGRSWGLLLSSLWMWRGLGGELRLGESTAALPAATLVSGCTVRP